MSKSNQVSHNTCSASACGKKIDALEQWNMRLCVAIRDVSRKLSNELGVDMVNHVFELTEPPDPHGDVDSG